ncbi:MAG: Gfo/Idh/MocA family oxidoreductase [Gemmatimonadales bacterium]|nr:Gfo/Idh/MocA family oxidoreductase [Gemmatimonadales bacterium]MDZ4388836.1 Gfo/Idh/MocA family oxidoreductase [Gemmatimonadales bacterium]
MKRLGLCLVGCGAIARRHARALRAMGRVELLFASRDAARAELFRREFRGIGAFGSAEEACGSPLVDAVVDCTPHVWHLPNAVLAAAHGKHLLIEKPVTRSVAELDVLRSAVVSAGVIAMVAENYLFKPVVTVMRELVERGEIGRPVLLEINRTNRSVVSGWRTDADLMGGGALLEGGVHWINYLTSLAGSEVQQVLAVKPTVPYQPVAPHEDTLEVLVKFADGSVGKLLHSWYLKNRLKGVQLSKLYGTEGNIVFESNGIALVVAGKRTRVRFPGLRDLMGYRAMMSHFVDCLERKTEPAMSLDVARRDLAVVEAAYRSIESGRFEGPAGRS